jgi:hypothetical protein
MTGSILPGFLDAHVHLALIDPAALAAGGISRVLDLGGWTPAPGASPAASPRLSVPVEIDRRADQSRPERTISAGGAGGAGAGGPAEAAFAGQFLTAPGGYPGRQAWAPEGSVCEVPTAADAAAAVERQLTAGASVIKVTLNAAAGPVLDGDVLAAIVAHAHGRGTPVVAHAEGVGQALRAFIAGVDVLAHTPFSERLVDGLVDAMAARMTWISTLDIHGWGQENDDFARASDNLRRFHAHGGRVLYGTDLGNGPLPAGLNRREIEALLRVGLSPDDVLGALTSALPRAGGTGGNGRNGRNGRPAADTAAGQDRVSVVPGERPADPAGFAEWLCGARSASRSELKEYA